MQVKLAPSDNWREVVDLWQCHDESYAQYLDPLTKELIVPKDTLLYQFNKIFLKEPETPLSVSVENGFLFCKNCNCEIGF